MRMFVNLALVGSVIIGFPGEALRMCTAYCCRYKDRWQPISMCAPRTRDELRQVREDFGDYTDVAICYYGKSAEDSAEYVHFLKSSTDSVVGYVFSNSELERIFSNF